MNALAGQEVSLVSELPGTTTDPVRKVIELPELGPCVLVDTA
ncbi:MAG: 50S ribosome-binding GTPase, partial [Clostridia bacterium]|nr:50S ribosome-binding GTPase [Clostridia bacterium]